MRGSTPVDRHARPSAPVSDIVTASLAPGPSRRRPTRPAGRSCRPTSAARPGTARGGSAGSGSTRGSSRRRSSSWPRSRRCAGPGGRASPGRTARPASSRSPTCSANGAAVAGRVDEHPAVPDVARAAATRPCSARVEVSTVVEAGRRDDRARPGRRTRRGTGRSARAWSPVPPSGSSSCPRCRQVLANARDRRRRRVALERQQHRRCRRRPARAGSPGARRRRRARSSTRPRQVQLPAKKWRRSQASTSGSVYAAAGSIVDWPNGRSARSSVRVQRVERRGPVDAARRSQVPPRRARVISRVRAWPGRKVEVRREEILAATVVEVQRSGLRAHPGGRRRQRRSASRPALVFYHFETKDRLLAEAFAYAAERDLVRLDKAVGGTGHRDAAAARGAAAVLARSGRPRRAGRCGSTRGRRRCAAPSCARCRAGSTCAGRTRSPGSSRTAWRPASSAARTRTAPPGASPR